MSRRKRRKKHTGLKVIVVIIILLAIALYDSNTRIVTNEYEVSSERLPGAFSGFRVVQLSDIHGAYGNKLDYLVGKVEAAEPDIIAITGDMIGEPEQLAYVEELIPRLTDIAEVYYVTGNHEWASGVVKELLAMLKDMGVHVLRNSYELLIKDGEEIIIAGIDDPNGPADMKRPPEVIERIRDDEGDKYMLLLVHRNDWLKKYSELDVDCVLSGHAHGGIIRLPFTDGVVDNEMTFLPTHTSGLYSENGTDMVVSRGLGRSRELLRLFNNPQIPVIILNSI